MLRKIVCTYGNKHYNLKDLRIASMCLICYSVFLRFSELVNLRRSDVTFFPTYIKLFLVKSKSDVYREGRYVCIAKTGLPTCPVDMLNRYLNLASIENTSQEFIFSPLYLSKSENVYKLRKSCQLSYTRSREMLLSALEGIGLDKKKLDCIVLGRAAPQPQQLQV